MSDTTNHADTTSEGRVLRKRNPPEPTAQFTTSHSITAVPSPDIITVHTNNKLPNGKNVKFTLSPDTNEKPKRGRPRLHPVVTEPTQPVKLGRPKKVVPIDIFATDSDSDTTSDIGENTENIYGGYIPAQHSPTPLPDASLHELQQYHILCKRNINAYRRFAADRRQQVLLSRTDLFEPFLIEKKPSNKPTKPQPIIEQTYKHTVHNYITQSPTYMNATLRDYQISGVNWIITHFDSGVGCILGDEMGLGKTIQSLTFLSYLKHVRKLNGPSIVVCPLAVASNWINEIKKFCNNLTYVKFQGGIAERDLLLDDVRLQCGAYDIVITTYETFIAELDFFQDRNIRWLSVIVDEAHRIKSATARLREGLVGIKSGFQLLLTGTPLQNNLHELWSLLDYLLPDVKLDPKIFMSCFDLDKKEIHTDLIPKAAALLDSLMLRRTKAQVETSLPPKTLINVYVPLTKLQIKLYRRLLMKDAQLNESLSYSQLMFVLVQLRKVCNHPSTLFIHRFNASDAKYKALYNHLQKNDTELEDLITQRRDIFNKFAPPPVYRPVIRRPRNTERIQRPVFNISNAIDSIRNAQQANAINNGINLKTELQNDTVSEPNTANNISTTMDVEHSENSADADGQTQNTTLNSLQGSRSSKQLDLSDPAVSQFLTPDDNTTNVQQQRNDTQLTTSKSHNELPPNDTTRNYQSIADATRRQCRHQCGCRDTRTGEIGPAAIFYSNSWWKHEANVRIHPHCNESCQQNTFLKKNAGFEQKQRVNKTDTQYNARNRFMQQVERKLVDSDNTTNQQPNDRQHNATPTDQQLNTSPNTIKVRHGGVGRRPKSGYAEIDEVNLSYTSYTVLDEKGQLIQLHACRHLCGCINRITGITQDTSKPAAFTHRGSRYSHELRGTLHPNCSPGLECYKLIIKGELKDQLQHNDTTVQNNNNTVVDTQQLNAHLSYHEQLKAKIEQQRRLSASSIEPIVKQEPNDTVKTETDNNDITLPLKSESMLTESSNDDTLLPSDVPMLGSVDDTVGDIIEVYRAIALDTDYIILVVMIERDGTVVCEIEANRLQHVEIDVNNISENDLDYRFMPIDQLIRASGKLTIMHKLLLRLHSEGSRVLIFTHFTSCLDVLERYVLEQQWQYKRMDGHTNRVIRELDIRDFNKHPEYFIYLISTKSGGQGINLAAADVVILYDCDWNPQADLQAEDRAHRIGQKKPVRVYRLVTENTVEERIVQRAMKKLALDSMVVGRGGTGQRNLLRAATNQMNVDNNTSTELLNDDSATDAKQVSSREVFNMLKYGADTIFRSTGTDISDVDLDALLSRSKRHEVDKSHYAEQPENDVDVDLGGIQTIFMQDFKERLPDEEVTVDEHSKHDHNMLTNAVDNMLSDSDSAGSEDNTKLTCQSCQTVNDIESLDNDITEIQCSNCNMLIPVQRSESPQQSIDSTKPRRTYDGVAIDNIIDESELTVDPITGRKTRMRAARLKPMKQFEQEPIKRESLRPKMQHEQDCFICEDTAANLECSQCPKVYHLSCLGIDSVPKGRWACGWHHCTVCNKGKSLVGGILFSCISCPTSYCFDDLPETVRILRLKSDHIVVQKLKQNHYKVNFDNLMFYQCNECKHKYSKLVDVAQAERQQHDELLKQRETYQNTRRQHKHSNDLRKRKKLDTDVQRIENRRQREHEQMIQAEAYDLQHRYPDNHTEQQKYVIQESNRIQQQAQFQQQLALLPAKKQRHSSISNSIDDTELSNNDTYSNSVNNRRTSATQLVGIELPMPQRTDDKAQTLVPYVDTAIQTMPMQQYIIPNSIVRCRYCHTTERPYIQFVVPSIKSITQSQCSALLSMITKKQLKMLRTMRDSDLKQYRTHELQCTYKQDDTTPELPEQSNLQFALPLQSVAQYQTLPQSHHPVFAYPYAVQQPYYPPTAIPLDAHTDIQQRLQHPALKQFAAINLYPSGDEVMQLSQITQTHMSLIYEWFEAERQRIQSIQQEQYMVAQQQPDAVQCDWQTVPQELLQTQARINFYQQLYLTLGMQPTLEFPYVGDTPIDLYILWWHAIMEGLPSVWQLKQWQLFAQHIKLTVTDEQLQSLLNDMTQMFFFYRLNQFPAPVQEQLQARQLANSLRAAVQKLELLQIPYTDSDQFQWVNDLALLAGVDTLGLTQLQYIREHPYLGARLVPYNSTELEQRYKKLDKLISDTNTNDKPTTVFAAKVIGGSTSSGVTETKNELQSPKSTNIKL